MQSLPPPSPDQLANTIKAEFRRLDAAASAGDVRGAETCRRRIQEASQALERRADVLIQRAEKRWRESDPSPAPEAA